MSEPLPDRQQLLDIINGFRPASILGAAAELDLWTILGDQSLTAEQLAERLACDLRALTMLLDAMVSLQLLEKHKTQYAVPLPLRPWLVETSPETVLPMLRHAMNISRSWSQLASVIKTGVPASPVASIRGPTADRASFIAAMHTISGPMADGLVAQLAPLKFRRMLDVGGASGTWTLAFLRAVPSASAILFDLSDAIVQAKERISGTEFATRVTFVPGDFYVDDLPDGVDFAWVSAICHQHSRQQNRALFAKVCKALTPGGQIAIRDVVMEPCRTMPRDGALFAINMLVNTQSGGCFTFEEYAQDLQTAGFEHPRLQVKHEAMNSVILAEKP
jgi:SAM-dependent methyltransferase